MRLVGASAVAVDSKKGLEDAFAFTNIGETFAAAVGDGVTYAPKSGAPYPYGDPQAVARIAVDAATWYLARQPGSLLPHAMREAVAQAGRLVDEFNIARGYRERDEHEYGACAAAALVVAWCWKGSDGTRHGFVGSIGDSVILKVTPNGCELLSRDQLKAMQAYFRRCQFASKDERRYFQRHFVKNSNSIKDDRGNLIGYGVIDGNVRATQTFLDIREVDLLPGERLVLTSDALRVCSSVDDTDDASGYERVAAIVRGADAADVPRALIEEIRACEAAKTAPSDDATVVVMEEA